MRQGEIVERLLAAGATLEQRLPGDVTVLMLAAALGLPDLCARLLQAGANVHAGDAQGLTPLHCAALFGRSEEHTSELQSLMRISYAVFCLKKKKITEISTRSVGDA